MFIIEVAYFNIVGDVNMKTVVVVGGGITGLCTMHYVKRQMIEKNIVK